MGTKRTPLRLHAVFEECPEGGYHAYVPEIPGVHTQGETLAEARENLAEALELVLEHNRTRHAKPKGKVIEEPLACA